MYELLRLCHGALDRSLGKVLSPRALQAFRTTSLRIASRLFPARVQISTAQELEALALSQPWNPPELPDWVKAELAEIARDIDPAVHPAGEWVSSATFYAAPWTYSLPGDSYFHLKALLPPHLDHIIFVPWLKSGGADLGAIHFANALATDFAQRVAVIATENASSPWSDRLAAGVTFVPAGSALEELEAQHRIDVVVRLLLQISPGVIHVMNSKLAWEAVKRNGLALRQHSRIYASLYCDDINEQGLPVGYARSYLGHCHAMLDAVVSDNPVTPRLWCRQMGLREDLFHVVRFPAPQMAAWPAPEAAEVADGEVLPERHVLWAGRLDRQKRPDLLARIAKRMPEVIFDVHGGAVMDTGMERLLAGIPNIRLHGPYSSFADLGQRPTPVAFLYTSAWDGLPNVLLEAASVGLPIVASDVGGISDLLDGAQRVDPFEDVEGYVARLQLLIDAPAQALAWRQHQFERIRQAHSRNSFLHGVAALPGYVKPISADSPGQPSQAALAEAAGLDASAGEWRHGGVPAEVSCAAPAQSVVAS
ncbi:glycosyltransferase family 4 protein [Xenophilus sp. Marseille-Q4582]|uniref:glycosyltransferase family 4 protein n=1 Tax=Xenophilus sp. Marseille-Q4582 TaxID=2866600 RepID=UPI001CE46AAD|nr:glycosyltransferase family 4 protein [Xenophilus sp. Marseille-Q4582]